MSRSHRSLVLALVLMLALGSVALVRQPDVARAAGTFVVNTTRDLPGNACGTAAGYSGLCSLRQALNAAIAAGGDAEVLFNIPSNDNAGPSPMPGFNVSTSTWTITLGLVDTSQPVDTDDPLPPISVNGIFINGGSQATFSGLSIPGPLVFIDGTYVDNQGGLTVSNVSGTRIHRIGVINFSGNPGVPGDLQGVGIELFNATGSEIRGCYIGVNQAGTGAAPNDAAGILIQGGSNNTIGGNNSLNSEYNVISGNANDGILIRQGSTGNKIIGNRIGTDTTGTNVIANGVNGVQVELSSSGNQIGPPADQSASDATQRNIIAGNNGYGVLVNGTNNNSIHGNWIGANNFFNIRLPNKLGGVAIRSTSSLSANNNLIGGNTTSTRNIIAGNNGPGVAVLGPNASSNVIANNDIGIGFSNSVPVSNTIGVLISGGGDSNVIGGNGTTARRNIIGGNSQEGVRIAGTSANAANLNIVAGNYIGVASDSTTSRPNTGAGVVIDGYASQTTIGGASSDQRNVIANNGADGVTIRGTNVATTTLLKNTIQTNGASGVNISNARATTISGDASANNLISGNTIDGIRVTNSVSTTITFNSLQLNKENGVRVIGSETITTTIRSNLIGAQPNGSSFLDRGNLRNGVLVETGALGTSIADNVIFFNKQYGVQVRSDGTRRATILDNRISRNAAGGIVLIDDTDGLPGLPSKPNHDIDAPFGLQVNQAGQLTGRVYTTADSPAACPVPGCVIQLFQTDTAAKDGQGRDKIDVQVTLSANGYFTATLGRVPQQVALTATDAQGNTSEFGVFTAVYGPLQIGPAYPIPPAPPLAAAPGDVVTYTHRITNTGTVGFTDLTLTANSSLGWTTRIAPAGTVALNAGESKPVTLTLTLPTGADARVRAGSIERTRVTVRSTSVPTQTASVTDTTTVREQFVLAVAPLARTGSGVPGSVVPYAHTFTNNGNITGTLTLTATSYLVGPNGQPVTSIPAPGWTTTITPTAITLAPGQSIGATARVTVPAGAQTTDPAVQTQIRVNVTNPAAARRTLLLTDTTTVALRPQATMVFPQEGDVGAGETISFRHTVTNLSNGEAKFKLFGSSSLGSKIVFRSDTPGVTLAEDGTFTLNTTDKNVFNFFVDITIDQRATRGQTDLVTIGLELNGSVVGGASVQDTLRIVRNAILPRVRFPLIFK